MNDALFVVNHNLILVKWYADLHILDLFFTFYCTKSYYCVLFLLTEISLQSCVCVCVCVCVFYVAVFLYCY